MTIEHKNLLTCSQCSEQNDPGMLFCIYCGQGLTASAEKMRSKTGLQGGKCPTCSKEDELNMRFCVHCSAPMKSEQKLSRAMDKFSWEMELADDQKKPKKPTSAAINFKNAVQKSPTKKPLNFLPIGLAAGALFGFISLLPGPQHLILRTWLSGVWPAKSLTIYTKHPFAQVTVYQPSDAKVFTLAQTDAKGSVRFANLEAGDYNLRISGKGLRTAFTQIKIDPVKPTVIGYGDDKVVELEKDPNAEEAPNVEIAPNTEHNPKAKQDPKVEQARSAEQDPNVKQDPKAEQAPSADPDPKAKQDLKAVGTP
jgi:hypothetical protein